MTKEPGVSGNNEFNVLEEGELSCYSVSFFQAEYLCGNPRTWADMLKPFGLPLIFLSNTMPKTQPFIYILLTSASSLF